MNKLRILVVFLAASVFAKTKTDNGGYKIHGDGYTCPSYESKTVDSQKKEFLLYGKLAGASYQDNGTAYHDGGKEITTARAYQGTGYQPVGEDKMNELIKGSGLRVVTTANPDSPYMIVGKDNTKLNAVIFQNSGTPKEYVISFRGSKELGDWVDDGKQVADKLGVTPQQYKDAAALLDSVLRNTASEGNPIACTGHSLGGGLLTYAMASTDCQNRVKGYAYNGAGLSEKTMNLCDAKTTAYANSNIVNVRNQKDPVSYVGYHLGDMYEVTTAASEANKHTVKNDHGLLGLLDNMEAANTIAFGNGASLASKQEEWKTNEEENKADTAALKNFDTFATKVIESQASPTIEKNTSSETVLQNKVADAAREQSQQTPGELSSDSPLNNIPTVNAENSTIENVNATLEQELEKLKNGATTEEAREAIKSAGEIIKEKIKEAWEKGEKWVEEGGIRQLLLTQLDKNLTGKVSDADKQHILNMADKLCNINKDGGRSFAESLGTDGLPLLRSIAVQQLQNQISKALPKDVADNINNYIQMLAIDGYDLLDPEAKQQLLDIVKSAISEYLPYENTAQTLNKVIQDIYDGNAGTVLDTIGQVGTSLGIDLLKDALAKNLDPETAAKINALLDAYAQGGLQGMTEAARAELFAMIDKVAPGAESAAAIKNLLDGIVNGTVTATDFKNTVSSIAGDAANKLIDQSNLSPEAKHAAKEAIEVLKKNGFTGITVAAQAFIQDYVTAKLGKEAGQAAADIFHAIVTPGEDVWASIGTNLPIIGKAVGAKILAKVEAAAIAQIDKFIANHPTLAKIAEILGIDGKGIVNGIKNVWGILKGATSLKDALSKIGTLVVDGLKNLALNALKWGVQKLVGILNNLINKAVEWLQNKLNGAIGKLNNGLIKAGLSWLANQATKCAKCAAQKVVTKASAAALKWIESQRPAKPQTGTTVTTGSMGKTTP